MFIFSNLAMSLDGKIATPEREFTPLGSPEDLRQLRRLRKRCDAILIGASTLRTFRKPCPIPGKPKTSVNIILSSNLESLSPNWEFFRSSQIQRILFCNSDTPKDRLRKFRNQSDLYLLKKKEGVGSQIIRVLKNRGIKNLLVEGGGGVMWHFVSENLIDEYNVTLVPKIVGGRLSPTLVDGVGFPPDKILKLKLTQCRVVGQEIYLRYSKRTSKASRNSVL